MKTTMVTGILCLYSLNSLSLIENTERSLIYCHFYVFWVSSGAVLSVCFQYWVPSIHFPLGVFKTFLFKVNWVVIKKTPDVVKVLMFFVFHEVNGSPRSSKLQYFCDKISNVPYLVNGGMVGQHPCPLNPCISFWDCQ